MLRCKFLANLTFLDEFSYIKKMNDKYFLCLINRKLESDDFAFDMDEESPTSLTTPKSGSMFKSKMTAKRKTTLAGILSNMERHRIIERQDNSSPKAPTNPSDE